MKRWLSFPRVCLLAFVFLAGTLAAAAQQKGQALEQSFHILPGGTVEVNNPRGRIQVHTWDESYVTLRAEKVDPPGQPVYFSDLTLAASESTIVIETHPVDPQARIDLTLTVPRQVKVQIGTQSGTERASPPARRRADPAPPLPSRTGPAQPVPAAATGASGSIGGDRQRSSDRGQDQWWGPLRRRTDGRTASEGSMGVGVRVIPPLRSTPDGARPRQRSSDRDPFAVFDQDPFFNPDRDSINRSGRETGSSTHREWPGADRRESTRRRSGVESNPRGRPAPHRAGSAAGGSSSESSEAGDEPLVLNSELVNLNASVRDRSGRAITGLGKADFQVYEDGEQQQLAFFSPTSAPFNLILMLDMSGTTREKLQVIKQAAIRFVDALSPEDRVAVITFTRKVSVISPLTQDRATVRQHIQQIQATRGGTALYEALWRVVGDVLPGTRGQRNAIVLLTDGVDNSISTFHVVPTLVRFDDLLDRIEATDLIIYPIYLDTEREVVYKYLAESPDSYALARERLQMLAEATGGVMFRAQRVEDLDATYEQVASELRTVYSLGYYPTNSRRDGSWRQVRVKVKGRNAVVRTRAGYYAR